MGDKWSEAFIKALKDGDTERVKQIPKADSHNHFVLGGSRAFIRERKGLVIPALEGILESMQEMDRWNQEYIGKYFESGEGRRFLIEAAFVQAREDGVTVLEIGEDVWGLGQYFGHDVNGLTEAFLSARDQYAPDLELRLVIGLSRHCPVKWLLEQLEPFWGRPEFYSIDLYGDEMAQPIENFVPVYRKAEENHLVRKAHIGEWGTAEDIRTGVELLHLDEVQHGIAAVNSKEVMQYLAERRIRLNITPTSNRKLGRVATYEEHPIKTLYREGIEVTINSDDVLMFDSDVSKEYQRLYDHGTLLAEELDEIRVCGLRPVG